MNTKLPEEPPGRRMRRKHSAEFKASVIRACRQPGVSMSSVALANGLNATMLRKWVVEAERSPSRSLSVEVPIQPATFVPVAVPHAGDAGRHDIRIELQRGNVRITLEWPRDGAAECAAWMRELLR
jgi:transposase